MISCSNGQQLMSYSSGCPRFTFWWAGWEMFKHACKELLPPEKTLVDRTLESHFGQLFSLLLEDSSPCLKKVTANGEQDNAFLCRRNPLGRAAGPRAPWERGLLGRGKEKKPAALSSVLNSSASCKPCASAHALALVPLKDELNLFAT